MSGEGLQEVKNPSEIFLSERSFGSSGSSVVASLEGSRPILLEVQALVTPTSYGVPQRNSTGVDYRRLGLLLAVLEKRLGAMLGQYDVFVNIAGGVRIDEPAVDLGISLAIISSLKDIPVDSGYVSIGEIGLGGEVRTVGHIERRVQEAVKLGFKNIILPKNNLKGLRSDGGISLIGVEHIEEAVNHLFK
jgi:DNA repair protein RadA/Sms